MHMTCPCGCALKTLCIYAWIGLLQVRRSWPVILTGPASLSLRPASLSFFLSFRAGSHTYPVLPYQNKKASIMIMMRYVWSYSAFWPATQRGKTNTWKSVIVLNSSWLKSGNKLLLILGGREGYTKRLAGLFCLLRLYIFPHGPQQR